MANTNNIDILEYQTASGTGYRIKLDSKNNANGSATSQEYRATGAGAEEKAKKILNDLKDQYPNADVTVNGKQEATPFDESVDSADLDLDTPEQDSSQLQSVPPDEFTPQEDPYKSEIKTPPTSATAGVAAVLTKSARDTSGVASWRLQEHGSLTPEELCARKISGVGGEIRVQAKVHRENLPCENVIRGHDNNAFIILGNDRQTHNLSGYGGVGHTQCDMIDIVAGMGGASPVETGVYYDEEKQQTYEKTIPYQPDFFVDAARIYISQKTDIDRNFGLRQYKNVAPFESNPEDPGPTGAKSAIGLKADNIRVIARETLDIVTGTDSKNAPRGSLSAEKTGINIVANNNYDTLQPMVLGDNLNQALRSMAKKIEDLSNILYDFINHQKEFNDAIGRHQHDSPFFGTLKVEPSQVAKSAAEKAGHQMLQDSHMSILKHILNMAGFRSRYLSPSGSRYIKSENNRVN